MFSLLFPMCVLVMWTMIFPKLAKNRSKKNFKNIHANIEESVHGKSNFLWKWHKEDLVLKKKNDRIARFQLAFFCVCTFFSFKLNISGVVDIAIAWFFVITRLSSDISLDFLGHERVGMALALISGVALQVLMFRMALVLLRL